MNRRTFLRINLQTAGSLSFFSLLPTGCVTTPDTTGDKTMENIDKLVQRRSLAEFYVKNLSQKFATSPTVLTAWTEDYITASSAVNQWISTIQRAILEGKNPITEPAYNYQSRFDNAVAKSEQFLDSSRTLANEGPPKSPEMFALAVSLGTMLWNKYKNYQAAVRKEKAQELDQYKWRSMDEILKESN